MSNTTSKLVTPARLQQLLDCYGSSPTSWPEEERQDALTLLKNTPELHTLHGQTQQLDNFFTQHKEYEASMVDKNAMQLLQQRIMRDLPEQILDDKQDGIHKHDGRQGHSNRNKEYRSHRNRLWMSSLAASLFIVSLSLGVIHQIYGPGHTQLPPVASQHPANQQDNIMVSNDFDAWAWEDITGESVSDNNDNGAATMLALVDMELAAE